MLSRSRRALLLALVFSAATASTASAATIFTLTPSSTDFGSVKVGNGSGPVSFRLTIDCDTLLCSASFNPTPSSSSSEFQVLNLCPATIDIDKQIFGVGDPICHFVARFTPTSPGPQSATITTGPGGPTATVTGLATQDAVAVAGATKKCKKGGKKKGRAAKKCKKKKRK